MRTGPRLENRLPDEGINHSDDHPLREVAWLVGGTLAALALVIALIGWSARWLAPLVPVRAEWALADRLRLEGDPPEGELARRSQALQRRADRVAAHMRLPEGMRLHVRLNPAPVLNAQTTLGGRIQVFEGLLRCLRTEEALTALLAHEIGHVRDRHVTTAMGRGMGVALVLGALSTEAAAAAAAAGPWLEQAAGWALLGYSREHEREADAAALQASYAVHGHVGGLVTLFEVLGAPADRPEGPGVPELLRTHPLTPARREAAQDMAARNGWPIHGTRTPLDADLLPAQPSASPADCRAR